MFTLMIFDNLIDTMIITEALQRQCLMRLLGSVRWMMAIVWKGWKLRSPIGQGQNQLPMVMHIVNGERWKSPKVKKELSLILSNYFCRIRRMNNIHITFTFFESTPNLKISSLVTEIWMICKWIWLFLFEI